MSRRKNRDPGAVRQLHPTRSFEQLVGEATQAKLSGYIDNEIQQLGQALLQRQQQAFKSVYQRIVAIEEILLETVPNLTKEALAERVANIQDKSEGFEAVADGGVVIGDRVRLQIQTRTADQTEYQGESRLQIDNTGSGNTLGKELETALVGMRAGEIKEVKFGKDASLVANLTVNKISRQPAKAVAEPASDAQAESAEAEDSSEAVAATSEAPAEETASASINAG